MANQITDGRTNINTMEAVTNIVDTAGTANGTLDAEIFYQGSNSVGDYCTTTRAGMLYNYTSAQNLSNNHFYFLVNCGIVGLLDIKANGGLTVRFCGATITDFFEFYVGGSDAWPTAFSGGWVQFCVDIEATPSNTGGTPPATSAIQYVGITYITATAMPRMADNIWLDQIARLPDGSAGIIIEGRNAETTDWKWDDVVAQADTGKWGTCQRGPGGSVVLNTPVQFFVDDANTHAFTDTNQTILWDAQEFVGADLYGFTQLGANTGTSNLTAGVKTGTGDAATGSQGWTISASNTGVRWFLDVNAANIDTSNWYGCNFQHFSIVSANAANTDIRSCTMNDGTSCSIGSGEFARNIIVDANTTDGTAFITANNLDLVKDNAFTFSDGHAIQYNGTPTSTEELDGNTFTGYGTDATNDAALYNSNTSGTLTVNVLNASSPTVRTAAGGTTTVNNSVSIKVEALSAGSAVKIIANETVGTITTGDIILEGLADSNGELSGSINYEGAFDPSGLDVIVRCRASGLPNAAIQDDNSVYTDQTSAANSATTNDMNLLPTTPVVNQDGFIFGHSEQFTQLKLDIGTAGTGGFTITWQYWNGSDWSSLTGVSDGTSSFSNIGESIVSWTLPGGWATTTINSQGPFYYIRVLYTAGTVTIVPLGRKCKLDVTKYLPFNQNRTITSSGLTVTASWIEDTIATF